MYLCTDFLPNLNRPDVFQIGWPIGNRFQPVNNPYKHLNLNFQSSKQFFFRSNHLTPSITWNFPKPFNYFCVLVSNSPHHRVQLVSGVLRRNSFRGVQKKKKTPTEKVTRKYHFIYNWKINLYFKMSPQICTMSCAITKIYFTKHTHNCNTTVVTKNTTTRIPCFASSCRYLWWQINEGNKHYENCSHW